MILSEAPKMSATMAPGAPPSEAAVDVVEQAPGDGARVANSFPLAKSTAFARLGANALPTKSPRAKFSSSCAPALLRRLDNHADTHAASASSSPSESQASALKTLPLFGK